MAHLLASFMGMGLDPELAKDYWLGSEEPWNAEHDVASRFAKLAYIYAASAVVQIGIPGISIIAVSALLHTPRGDALQIPIMAWYVATILVLCGIAIGFFMAYLAWRRVVKQRRSTAVRGRTLSDKEK